MAHGKIGHGTDNPGHMIARSMMLLRRGITRRFKKSGNSETVEHWGLLNMLIDHEGINQTQLAEMICKDKPNLTRLLDRLERESLVRREKDPEDRRSYRLYVSDRGKRAVTELRPLIEEFVAEAFKDVKRSDYRIFMHTLTKIIANMEELESSFNCKG
ncbi:MAG: MarR family transcriptional regulator [bacterium]|nr:MarR family transcriptional regulator [bacterium]